MGDVKAKCPCGAALHDNHGNVCDTCGDYIPPCTMKELRRAHAEPPRAPKPLPEHPDNEPAYVDNYPPRIKGKGDES